MIVTASQSAEWARLRARSQSVYVALVARWEAGDKYATYRVLMRISGLSEASVMRSLTELRSRGFVREYRSGSGPKVRMPTVPVAIAIDHVDRRR
jgi:DNA-binding transcriptional MocR family regulator